ncbi:uncharacterized protein LOC121975595 [Zingiber officinale]|uniref:Uncharacterized protein n=1 Tax=Zingiber officinale TaxID=94328 RepID=A0A8J5GP63_ZINOF|nr:uncharacterized protein LOC121975595 [Zingiber officinale]KAG6511145.1 hypothetical protein ZIOFF_029200 [Zingiber officinale]
MNTPATASSRTRSATTSTRDRRDARSGGDSCYFPGCRKDTNCHCEICLASIHATRDLLPSAVSSLHQSSLTKLFDPRSSKASLAPVPYGDESPPSTRESADSTVTPPSTPPPRYPVKSRAVEEKSVQKKHSWPLFSFPVKVLVGFLLLWAADSGFSALLSKDFGPKLTPDVVSRFGEECRILRNDLKGMLELLQKRLEGVLDGKVANCSSIDSNWKMNQDDQFLLQWRCVLHNSVAERVSIWGSPLKTTGLLATGPSPPSSMTLLSGKIKEWTDGNLQSTTRTSNGSSWMYKSCSSAALHLNAETWVLQYEQSGLFQLRGLIPMAWEALRLKTLKKLKGRVFRMLRQCCSLEQHQVAFPT